MGIMGLTSFMSRNDHLFREFPLHDTKVVIDGSNLRHFIFKDLSYIDDTHGGDYERYACKIREFFSILQYCNVEPYVLLDGGDDPSGKKFNTKIKRKQEELERTMHQSYAREKRYITMPLLANKTFLAVLLEMNVHFFVCDFEADKEIGSRANHLNCPVLSFDSDFYILPLNAGYLPFDKIFFKPQEGKRKDNSVYHYLPAMIYHVDNFVRFFPALERNVLLLIALLLGNDYVDRNIFDAFYSSLFFDKDPTEFEFPRFSRLGKLINWLKTLETYEEGIQKVMSTAFTSEHKEIISSAIKITGEEFTFNNKFQNTDTILLPVLNGTTIPSCFAKLYRQGRLPTKVMNILTSRTVFLRSQVENCKSPSSHKCCAKLRKFMYCILLSEDLHGVAQLEIRDKMVVHGKIAVDEYDRDGYKLIKNVICPKSSTKMNETIPKLSEIPNLSPSDREKTLRLALDIPVFHTEHLSKALEMILGIVLFWKKNAQPNATENHLKSVLVCLIMLKVKSIVYHESTGCEQNLLDDAILGMSNEQRKEVNNQLLRFCHSEDHRVDTNLIHGFAQLQACFMAAMDLNFLLLCPLPSPCIFQIISGTFLYNFFVELQKRRNPDKFIHELLLRDSSLPKVYQILYATVMNSLLEGSGNEQRKINSSEAMPLIQ